jgi:hypothetical protein
MSPRVSFQIKPECCDQISAVLAKAGMSFQVEREYRVNPSDWPVKPTGNLPINFQTGKLHTPTGPLWAEIQSNGERTRFSVNVAGLEDQSSGEVSWSEIMRKLVTWPFSAKQTKSTDDVLILLEKIENALRPVMQSENQKS